MKHERIILQLDDGDIELTSRQAEEIVFENGGYYREFYSHINGGWYLNIDDIETREELLKMVTRARNELIERLNVYNAILGKVGANESDDREG